MLAIYGTHGVNYVRGRELVRGGYLCGAGGATVESTTLAEKGWTGSGMDGAVLWGRRVLAGFCEFGRGCVKEAEGNVEAYNATSTQQRRVCGIDNASGCEGGDGCAYQ